MLREIDRNIWISEQPLKYWGFEVGTRMTILRLTNGELIVISPIKVDKTTIHQINDIGDVTFIVAPNLYHHLFVSDFKSIYPKAKVWVAPGLEFKRRDLPIDEILNNGVVGSSNEVEFFCLRDLRFLI